MNIVLWALQIVLALKFVSVAYTHGFRADQTKMQRGNQRLGAVARPLLILIALCETVTHWGQAPERQRQATGGPILGRVG